MRRAGAKGGEIGARIFARQGGHCGCRVRSGRQAGGEFGQGVPAWGWIMKSIRGQVSVDIASGPGGINYRKSFSQALDGRKSPSAGVVGLRQVHGWIRSRDRASAVHLEPDDIVPFVMEIAEKRAAIENRIDDECSLAPAGCAAPALRTGQPLENLNIAHAPRSEAIVFPLQLPRSDYGQ
jgi:hypothetical protein